MRRRIDFAAPLCQGRFMRRRPFLQPLRLALLLLCAGLAACGDPVDVAREARLAPDASVSVAKALARYPYFTRVVWSSREHKDGRIIVEAACELNVAAACRQVAPASLALATQNVARDYVLARFVVDGLPRRARALEALHVTECVNGKRLSMADPKLLRAVYNREEIPFFCLEGLNCAGQ